MRTEPIRRTERRSVLPMTGRTAGAVLAALVLVAVVVVAPGLTTGSPAPASTPVAPIGVVWATIGVGGHPTFLGADSSATPKPIPDPTPVMGWSSWSFLREGANASEVEGEASALVSTGLAAAGYRYVNVDDGWYECPGPQGPNVDAYGRWVVDPARYPDVGSENGIAALAAYVHGLGLKFGIYETTGISRQAVARNTPVLGTSYTADEIATTTPENNYNCGGMVGLDYRSPGAQAFVDSIVEELASWGVDYVKLDGVTNHNVPDLRAWAVAIQRSGRAIVLDSTEGSFTAKIAPELEKFSDQWEFSPDIEISGPDEGGARGCDRAPYPGCRSVFPLTSYVHWKDRFDAVADWQPYGGPGGFNDYDSIEVGDGPAASGMSYAAEESQLSLWALGDSPLILGSDLSANVSNAYGSHHGLDPRDLALLTNAQVIAVDQDGIDASRISLHGPAQVFAKVELDGVGIVGLFDTDSNLSAPSVSVATTPSAMGLPSDALGYWVDNLWTGRTYWIAAEGRIGAVVPPEGVELLSIAPVAP